MCVLIRKRNYYLHRSTLKGVTDDINVHNNEEPGQRMQLGEVHYVRSWRILMRYLYVYCVPYYDINEV